MRKFGHKIAKPSLLHKPDFAGRPFHMIFTAFSWPFHGSSIVSLCSQISKLRQFFKHGISLGVGVGPSSAKSHKNIASKIITWREPQS